MTRFIAKLKDGSFNFGSEQNIEKFRHFAKFNVGKKVEIKLLTPESRNQRGYFEGAVIPLFVYLDGADYRDNEVVRYYRDYYIKPEFNGEAMTINGKAIKVGKSTKNQLQNLIEKVVDWLEEQYGIDRRECLDPEEYKKFRDEIYPVTDYDSYIDYLVEMKKLPAVYLKQPKK